MASSVGIPSDIVEVAIPEADRNRTDELYATSGTHLGTVATGPFWTKIFSGDPHTSPVFTIKSTKIQSELIAHDMAARVHYIVDGSLSFEGRDYPIHAEGARATAAHWFNAASEAIQLGIVDAAHKVKFIISGGPRQE